MSDFQNCHPLEHQGASRISRLVEALRPDSFQLDERTMQDLIVEAHRFAQTLRFFDETNTQPEDAYWDRFWEVEVLTYLAVVAARDTEDIKLQYLTLDQKFGRDSAVPSASKKSKLQFNLAYQPLLENLRSLALSLEDAYQKLVHIKHPLQSLLLNRIQRDNCCDQEELEGALTKLIGFHKAADANLPKNSYATFYAFGKHWGLKNQIEYDAISANPNFAQEDLRGLFYTFYNTWLVLKNAAQQNFDAELARMELPEEVESRIVQPHIVLFLVFLRLFRYAQESMNELGTKHLDYYYEEVLGLRRRGEIPDEVYLLFELAKDFDQHLLEKGTEFVAGKDKNGQPLLFETLEDWVLRPAQVADIKNTWIDLNCGGIHSNPDVKKVYYKGAEKPNESAASWRTMGDDRHLPDGEVGFAIASPQLILREGKRVIDVELKLKNELVEFASFKPEYFQLFLSSTEEWITLRHDPLVNLDSTSLPELIRGAFGMKFTLKSILIRVVLERDDLPVDHLGEELAAQAGFGTKWPIMKVIINPNLAKPCPTDEVQNLTTAILYENLRTLLVNEIVVKVNARGIRENLIIQSDQGVFDGTQKVLPFGSLPSQENQFYIGSTEVFQKSLNSLMIHFKWIDTPVVSFGEHYSAYEKIGIKVPDPTVQVDFIDKAQDSEYKKITKSGKLGTNKKVTGIVSDVMGNLLASVKVEALTTKNTVNTNADGMYEIELTENAVTATMLKFSKGAEDFEEFEEAVEDFSKISIVLFPRRINVTGAFKNQVNGRITDVYGNLLSGVTILSTPSNQQINSSPIGSNARKDNYSLAGLSNTDNLKFTLEGFQELAKVGFDKFTIVDAILRPTQKTTGETGTLNNRMVSGTISGTNGAAEVGGVSISSENSLVLVKTKSRDDGTYAVHLPNTATQINYFTNENIGAFIKTPVNNGLINVQMFPHLHLEKQLSFNGNVSGRVTNIQGAGVNNALVEVINDPSKNTTTDNFGKFSINGLTENSELEISHTDFKILKFRVGKCSELDIKLFPAVNKRVAQSGVLGTTLNGKVTGLDGVTGIEGVKISQGNTSKTTTAADGTYSITGLSGTPTLKYTKPGFIDQTIQITNATANVLLEPEASTIVAGSSNKIKITVIDLNGKPVPNSKFLAEESTILDFSLKNNETHYTLDVPEDSSWEITAYDDGYSSEKITVEEGNEVTIVLSKQIQRKNPIKDSIRGKITNVSGQNVAGVSILSSDKDQVLLTESNTEGEFELNNLAANPFSIIVRHGAYEQLIINIDDASELAITLTPKKVFNVLTGKITDVTKLPINGATYGVKGTGILKTATGDGLYDLSVPADLVNPVLFFKSDGYEKVELEFAAHPPTFSQADIRLYFVNLNKFKLIQEQIVKDFAININALNLIRDVRTQEFEKYSPTLKRGFIRFTLKDDDFRHIEYPKVLTTYALDAAKIINVKGIEDNVPALLPNPPYTPATNSISLDYTSTQIISGAENEGIDQYFHLLSFNGHKWISLDKTLPTAASPEIQLIYPYMPDDTLPVMQGTLVQPYAPGNLFIGISELQPGGTLSLLFQIADGTATEPEALAPHIHWTYLAEGNTWLPFKTGDIIQDQTFGLTRSGMIQFAIPTTAVKENTMLNPEYYWLRAAAKQADPGKAATKVQALPSMSNIRAQVVQVRFKNNGNEFSHLAGPLLPDTISNLLESRTAIKKVEQPLESFGGRLPESIGTDFYRRISERLRHKDRAITIWDYEHLLLEQFPEVATAKCIPHTRYKPADAAAETVPGFVSIAVVPDLKKRKGEPWPEPRFTQGDLDDMRLYLAAHANLFVADGTQEEAHLQVLNPLYEKVDVQVTVGFMPKIDEEFFKEQLKTELTHYISPWLADAAKIPVFGRQLKRSGILQFIEERPYVDYVDMGTFKIRMQVIDKAGRPLIFTVEDTLEKVKITTITSRYITEKICPGTARSILVTGNIVVGSVEDTAPAKLPVLPATMKPSAKKPPVEDPKLAKSTSTSAARIQADKAAPTAPKAKGKTKK